ncbi:MAG TPA: hypothetical protein VFQ36_09945 [Ktedonobacteraceae bacterium]|nr:hypothetical protein [Ktedonobacteraceae bacterium]
MEVSTLSTPTQMILAWILVGLLLTWLVIFATLALRNRRIEPVDVDELPTPAGSFPAITMQVIHQQNTLAQVGIPISNAPRPATPVSSHSGRALPQTDHSD